ncbi:TRAP transporter small permease [Marinobacter sp. 1-3A]|uniref:TRAP transporter small permease n=1 Tax=Marinobacter sp. 1-3A TaxID=2582920 RepID=UPI001906CD54|nr:TRAP transporter small permease [Marinobacter sp. 1-3A]MBK1875056.1 TRAP transporter small permease [Marinobacter sp. 1-3A]
MSPLSEPVLTVLDTVDKQIVRLGQLMLASMVMLTFVSVVGRTFFSSAVPDDLLISEMLMVAVVFMPMAYVQSQDGHLEVTVLTDHLPLPVQTGLQTVGLIFGVIFFGLMAYLSGRMAWESWEYQEIAYASSLGIPEWPVKAIIPLGLGWWCIRMVVQLVIPSSRHRHLNDFDQALEESEKY